MSQFVAEKEMNNLLFRALMQSVQILIIKYFLVMTFLIGFVELNFKEQIFLLKLIKKVINEIKSNQEKLLDVCFKCV